MLSADGILVKNLLYRPVSVDLYSILSLKRVREWSGAAQWRLKSIHSVSMSALGNASTNYRTLARFTRLSPLFLFLKYLFRSAAQVRPVLYSSYFLHLLDLKALVSLRPDILNETSLVLEELLETPALVGLPLFASVNVRSELAALEFLLLFCFPHRPQFGFLFVQEILHFKVECGRRAGTVGGALRVQVFIHHGL